jgi:hypothetical protein
MFRPFRLSDLGRSPRLRASAVEVLPFRSPDHPMSRSPDSYGPPPPRVIPDWRRLQRGSSQVIPDWRGLQRYGLDWRRVQRFRGSDQPISRLSDHPIFAALCLRRSARPHPPIEVLLQTKGEVPFDRAVTARSNPFFLVLSGSNHVESRFG